MFNPKKAAYFNRTINIILVLCFSFILAACNSSGTSNNSNTVGKLSLSFANDNLTYNESTIATVTLVGADDVNNLIVTVTSLNSHIASTNYPSCVITSSESGLNTCSIIVTASNTNIGSVNIVAGAHGYNSVESKLAVVPPLYIGNNQGVVYQTSTLLAGDFATSLDGYEAAAVAIDDSSNIYAGTSLGNVYKFESLSGTWTNLGGNGSYGVGLSSVTFVNGVAATVSFIVVSNNNIYASVDSQTGGDVYELVGESGTWIKLGNPSLSSVTGGSYVPIFSIALLGNNVYAGSASGNVYELIGGESGIWTNLGAESLSSVIGSGYIYSNSIVVSNGHVYAGVDNGNVYELTSESGFWTNIGNDGFGLSNVTESSLVSSIALKDGDVYAGVSNGNVYELVAGIGSWVRLGDDGGLSSLTESSAVSSIALKDGNVYAGIGYGAYIGNVYKLANGAGTWSNLGSKSLNSIIGNTVVWQIAVDEHEQVYAAAGNNHSYQLPGNVFKLTGDSGSWTNLGGYTSIVGYSIQALCGERGNVYAASNNNVYELSSGVAGWSNLGVESLAIISDNIKVNSIAVLNGNVYAGTGTDFGNGNVYELIDGGSGTWESIGNPSLSNIVPQLQVNSLAVASGNVYAGLGTGSVYELIGGESGTWESLGYPSLAIVTNSSQVTSVIVTGNIVYAGVGDGNVYKLVGGESATWSALGTPSLSSITESSIIYSIAVKGGNVYAAAYNGNVYVLESSTQQWNVMGNPQLSAVTESSVIYLNSLVVDSSGNVYASAYNGVVYKLLGGVGAWIRTNYGNNTSTVISLGH